MISGPTLIPTPPPTRWGGGGGGGGTKTKTPVCRAWATRVGGGEKNSSMGCRPHFVRGLSPRKSHRGEMAGEQTNNPGLNEIRISLLCFPARWVHLGRRGRGLELLSFFLSDGWWPRSLEPMGRGKILFPRKRLPRSPGPPPPGGCATYNMEIASEYMPCSTASSLTEKKKQKKTRERRTTALIIGAGVDEPGGEWLSARRRH